MKNTIAGNYKTTKEEIQVVKAYLDKHNIKYLKIYKYEDANAGDVMVVFPNHLYSLFEVKQEGFKRFNKYKEYGIDFISSFRFKNEDMESSWKGLHKPKEYNNFIETFDINSNSFKWGKLMYSYSDVWLFYTKNPETGEYTNLEAYKGKEIHTSDFLSYLKNNCMFAVNNKSSDQLSFSDKNCSATFYISPSKIEHFKIKSEKDIYHNHTKAFEEILLLNNSLEENDSEMFRKPIAFNGELIGNRNVEIFHIPSCKYAPMKKEKRIEFDSFEKAEDNGYRPCNYCIQNNK